MIVNAAADEAGIFTQMPVLRGQRLQVGQRLHLRKRRRQVQPLLQADRWGKFSEQIIFGGRPDMGQHLPPFSVG